jgi:serine/threonine-protein kinase
MADDHECRLDDVIAAYVLAAEAGEAPDREELLRLHPDLADDLRAFFADFSRIDRQAAALRALATPAPVPEGLRTLGDYELLEEIGRGGMGIVYKARQMSLNRLVAVKMILGTQLGTPEDVERFRREARTVATLDHPHIVPLYEVGEDQGRLFSA